MINTYRKYYLGLGKKGLIFKVIHQDLSLGLVKILYPNGSVKTVTNENILSNSYNSSYDPSCNLTKLEFQELQNIHIK